MLSSRRFYVELNNDRSRWRNQKNSLPHGSVLSPIPFSIYTNDQPLHHGTRNYVYADYLCVTAQYPSFTEVKHTIEKTLDELTNYYRSKKQIASPVKTQVTTFHLKNREEKKTLEVKWNNTDLENTPHPKYLGITLDRTLGYKKHMHNTQWRWPPETTSWRSYQTPNGVATQALLEQQHWRCLTPRLNTHAKFGLDLRMHHRMFEANQCRKTIPARGDGATWYQKRCMC